MTSHAVGSRWFHGSFMGALAVFFVGKKTFFLFLFSFVTKKIPLNNLIFTCYFTKIPLSFSQNVCHICFFRSKLK